MGKVKSPPMKAKVPKTGNYQILRVSSSFFFFGGNE